MRFKALEDLARPAPREIVLATLPEQVGMTDYARAKAFLVSELVRRVHHAAYEWYGFTLAEQGRPEIICDVGLPDNAENQENYTSISAELIAAYAESLPAGLIINGWLHSHGAMEYRHFSPTDEANQATVLDYVTSLLAMPVAQKEVVIRDLALKVLGEGASMEAAPGDAGKEGEALPAPASVTLFTDVPVGRAKLSGDGVRGLLLRHRHRRQGLDQTGNPLQDKGHPHWRDRDQPPGSGPDPGKVRPGPHPLGPGGPGRGGQTAPAAGDL